MIAAASGTLLRVAIGLRSLTYLDRLFIPDDTYYTLAIARSLARGLGPSADGQHLTNGFQPLLAFLVAPLWSLTHDRDALLRCTLLLLATLDGVLAFVLGELSRRMHGAEHGNRAALVTTFAWSTSPLAISYALGGLETTLAMLIAAWLTLAWADARRSQRQAAFVRAGVLAGLAVMARIDLVLLVVMLGGLELLAGSRRGAISAALAAATTVAPWFAYELVHFGTVVPQSGDAVREQAALHQARYLGIAEQAGWAIGAIWEALLGRMVELRALCFEQPAVAVLLSGLALLTFVHGLLRGVASGPAALPLRSWLGFGLLLWPFYTLYVPAIWFFPRYLAPVHACLSVLLGVLIVRRAATGGRSAVLACVALVSLTGFRSLQYLYLKPASTVDSGLYGAKGYRQSVREILRQTPEAAVIGALQSGALAYYADGGNIRIVNLDGVVDYAAAQAFRSSQLAEFARARGVTHLCDWPVNIAAALQRAGDSTWQQRNLRFVARASAQGEDSYELYALPVSMPQQPDTNH